MRNQIFPFVISLILAVAALAIFLQPFQFLSRFAEMPAPLADVRFSLFGLGAGLVLLATAFVPWKNAFVWVVFAVAALAMLGLQTAQFSDWLIDDAGITFAYARSLAEGFGLTYHPMQPPEEGYSSTLWMLILALSAKLGVSIPAAAKYLGIACGFITLLVVIFWTMRRSRSIFSAAIAVGVITTAPFVIWVSSGQEHALQALILTLAAISLAQNRAWGVLWLTLLVFLRPEAPIIVAACFFAALGYSRASGAGFRLLQNLPIALVPFLAFVALTLFRIWYFGDPLPNPFYAKTSQADLLGLLNPFGGGWHYILTFLSSSVVAIVIPFLLMGPAPEKREKLTFFYAILAGHLLFVIWADGDWMGQFRFIMPILPILAMLAADGFSRNIKPVVQPILAATVFLVLSFNSVHMLNAFKAKPTTPLALVSDIGNEFASVAQRLGIDDPVLAHHDAGAIAFERSIGLIDLGGLVDRQIGKHLSDPDFLRTYVLDERKPDFIFGARNFAAGSGFLDSDTFGQNYVPISFPTKPFMASDYSHIRRDRAKDVSGITVNRDSSGQITDVVVE